MSSGLVVTGFSIAARQKIWIGIKVYVQDKLIKHFLSVLFVVTLNMINILWHVCLKEGLSYSFLVHANPAIWAPGVSIRKPDLTLKIFHHPMFNDWLLILHLSKLDENCQGGGLSELKSQGDSCGGAQCKEVATVIGLMRVALYQCTKEIQSETLRNTQSRSAGGTDDWKRRGTAQWSQR